MSLVRKDDRHNKKRGKKIKLTVTSKREERAPKNIDFTWMVRNCKLRPKFLREAIKAIEKEYPQVDFYQEFDWWQEGCPRISEEGDREGAFWDYLSSKGFTPRGDMIEKQETDARERQQMEHEALRLLQQPCGGVKILNLAYNRDPRKQWVTRKDKDWLKNLLIGNETKVHEILQDRCGNGPNKELARIWLRDSFLLDEQKNIERFTKNKETVVIRSERGWITHINKEPLRVKLRSADLADTNFFEKYEEDKRLSHPDKKGTVAYYKKIPKGGRPPKPKKKFELDEDSFIARPRTMKIKTSSKEKVMAMPAYIDQELEKKLEMARGERDMPRPPKKPTKLRRLKDEEGEFQVSGGGQRDLFGGMTDEEKIEEIRRKMRRGRRR